ERRRLVRLNADGTIDRSFTVSISTAGIVYRVVPQPDGKILIAGDFEMVNGATRNRIARLNADGSLDAAFNVGSGANATIFALALQPDGKILIGGSFSVYNGATRARIARLNADGSLDTTFNFSDRTANIVFDIKLQPDGKILGGGSFSNINSPPSAGIVRLTTNGSLDSSFGGFPPLPPVTIRTIAVQADGKILVGGGFGFSNSDGFSTVGIYRINANGTLDSTFRVSLPSASVEAISVLPDGRILIGGTMFDSNNQFRGLLRLQPNGAVDPTFNATATVSGTIRALLVQADGKILVGGFLASRVARLNADGSRDTSFSAVADNFVDDIAIARDGKILLGGAFTIFNNAPRRGIVRLQGSALLASRRTMFDYDGDGRADVSVFRPSNSVWYLLNSNTGFSAFQFGISTDRIVPADYDGDGKTDIALYRPAEGNWYILGSARGFTSTQFGAANDIPAPADYDGDGKTDIAVFRPEGGNWYQSRSVQGFATVQFGVNGDRPTPNAFVP
nr:FG-GAP-like repeat-containing protein [Acidobacteriota bacterium]